MEQKFARKINNELNTLIRYKSDIFAGAPYEIKSPVMKQKLILDETIDNRNSFDMNDNQQYQKLKFAKSP